VTVELLETERHTGPQSLYQAAIEHAPLPMAMVNGVSHIVRTANPAFCRQEADIQKNQFLAMLAHELRNPLTPIRLALDLMKRADNTGDLVKPALDDRPASTTDDPAHR